VVGLGKLTVEDVVMMLKRKGRTGGKQRIEGKERELKQKEGEEEKEGREEEEESDGRQKEIEEENLENKLEMDREKVKYIVGEKDEEGDVRTEREDTGEKEEEIQEKSGIGEEKEKDGQEAKVEKKGEKGKKGIVEKQPYRAPARGLCLEYCFYDTKEQKNPSDN
jgi:hypothetical protein